MLIICSENFSHFCRLLCNCGSFLGNFCMWIEWKLIKAGNCECFFGNEGKDVNSKVFHHK